MSILPNYHDTLVIQRQQKSGCVPSAIEWVLKYLKIENVNFNGFQEKYDLIYQKKGNNDFGTISNLIKQDYPQVALICKIFEPGCGKEKIEFINDLINKTIPGLISISLSPYGGWHIVPVVEIDERRMAVLWMIEDTIERQKKEFPLSEIEFRHNEWPGGRDILYCIK